MTPALPMPIDTTAAPPAREVLRCHACDLVQFATIARICRRCRVPYPEPGELPATAEATRFCHNVGLVLRAVRLARGFTCARVARHTGFTRQYISAIELGDSPVYIEAVTAICDVLSTPLSAVLNIASDRKLANARKN